MKRILISLLALMLALSLSLAAMAEGTDTAADTVTDTATALQEAQTAYNAAKKTGRMTDYESELKTMVEAGTLTQEQADLLLTAAKDATALASGVCPSCGYQFQNTATGRNGHGFGKQHGSVKQSADTATDLEAAQAAYSAAKQSSAMTDYETELKSMVEAGTLTQEQADLLLNAAKESAALANGTCPGCGYQFQTVTNGQKSTGKNGGMGRGGKH